MPSGTNAIRKDQSQRGFYGPFANGPYPDSDDHQLPRSLIHHLARIAIAQHVSIKPSPAYLAGILDQPASLGKVWPSLDQLVP
jgi:hypothetical protein